MKTKRNLVQVCVLAVLQTLASPAHAQFTVTTNINNTLTITGYTGPGGSLVIPTNIGGLTVSSIGGSAFWGNSTLTNVTIGTNITNIGSGPFGNCGKLKAFEVDPQNPAYSSSNGVIFDKGATTLIQFPSGLATNYTIPNGVASIAASAFAYCNLTNIVIPAATTNIGISPFLACDKLKGITVDPANPDWSSLNGVLFDEHQFTLVQYPGGIKQSYTIPNGVTTIAEAAFRFCTVTNLTISSTVTNIQIGGVSGCGSLNAFTVQTGNPALTAVNGVLFNADQTVLVQFPGGQGGSYSIPTGVTNMPDGGGFAYCGKLTDVTIPGSVANIGNSAFTFNGALKSVTFLSPPSVTTIASFAFLGCTSLTNITIPASVTTIAGSAFAGCSSLTGIYFLGNAPQASTASFTSDNLLTLYYLPGATGWNSPIFGVPAALWNPQVQSSSASFGVISNSFGFNITGNTNMIVVVEATTNLAGGAWSPVATNTLGTGLSRFSDPQWTNYPSRFYRFRVPF